MRRWLSGLIGVVALLVASSGVATGAPAGGESDDVTTRGGDGETLDYEETIEFSIQDIQEFWTARLPEFYTQEYREIETIIPYDEDTPEDELPVCGEELAYEDIADNAFYCVIGADTGDDFIAYDDGSLFPQLFEDFGPFALNLVLAHEWGHAIQGQVLTFDSFVNAPSIQKELQADCFAGAYVQWIETEESPNLRLDPGDLEIGLAGMLAFKDPLGTAPDEEGAHGSGFDRVNAFQEGFEQGVARCTEYEDPATFPVVTEIPFTDEEDLANEGNLPFTDAVEFGLTDLELYWEAVFEVNDLDFDPVSEVVDFDTRRKGSLPECQSLDLTPKKPKAYRNAVFYCTRDDFIAYDRQFLKQVHGEVGDFGAMILLANAYAAAMQERLDLEGEARDQSLQADCFGGAYAGSVPVDEDFEISARGEPVPREAEIRLSPGDLDEVVTAFVGFRDESSAEGSTAIAPFERIAAFRTGFFSAQAESDCAALTG